MRRLYLLRHARAAGKPPGGGDFDRPLNSLGEREAAAMAGHCRAVGAAAGRIVCSPAARAAATMELVAAAMDDAPSVEFDRRIYEAGRGALLAVVGETPDETASLLLVGHNPGMHGLASYLSGADVADFPPGALAVLELEAGWRDLAEGAGRLAELTMPGDVV